MDLPRAGPARQRPPLPVRPDFDLEPCNQEKLQVLELLMAERRAHPESDRSGALPELPLDDQSFDRVLCGDSLSADAHLAAGEQPMLWLIRL